VGPGFVIVCTDFVKSKTTVIFPAITLNVMDFFYKPSPLSIINDEKACSWHKRVYSALIIKHETQTGLNSTLNVKGEPNCFEFNYDLHS